MDAVDALADDRVFKLTARKPAVLTDSCVFDRSRENHRVVSHRGKFVTGTRWRMKEARLFRLRCGRGAQ